MKSKGERVKGKVILTALLTASYPLLATSAYAEVDIGTTFGFGGITSLGDAVSRLVPIAFSLAAVAVVIYFLMGSLKFLMSGGNKEAVAEGRNMITHAIIGFIILIFSFLIIQFLLSALFGITDLRLFKS